MVAVKARPMVHIYFMFCINHTAVFACCRLTVFLFFLRGFKPSVELDAKGLVRSYVYFSPWQYPERDEHAAR